MNFPLFYRQSLIPSLPISLHKYLMLLGQQCNHQPLNRSFNYIFPFIHEAHLLSRQKPTRLFLISLLTYTFPYPERMNCCYTRAKAKRVMIWEGEQRRLISSDDFSSPRFQWLRREIFLYLKCDLRSFSTASSHSPFVMLRRCRWERGENGAAEKKDSRISLKAKQLLSLWYCYLHSEYKPIIAIKFAIKYRIKMCY